MRRLIVPLVLLLVIPIVHSADTASQTESDKPPEGFTALFDGKTLEGWQILNGKLTSWAAENGVLFVKGGGGEVLLAEVMPGYSTSATIARFARSA